MKVFLGAVFVMILLMGWGLYVKETYTPFVAQTDTVTPNDHQATTELPGTQTDTTAPAAPQELKAVPISKSQVSLKWQNPAGGTDIAEYHILRNGVQVASTINTSYTDISTFSGGTFTYTVVAYDNAGNASYASNAATLSKDQISRASGALPATSPVAKPKPASGATATVTGVSADANGATVTIKGTAIAVRYSTDSVLDAPVTLSNGRHSIVWPQSTAFVCYQAKGSNGIWTDSYCGPVSGRVPVSTPTFIPSSNPTVMPTIAFTPTPTTAPTATPIVTPTPTPTANPTPTPSSTPTATPTPTYTLTITMSGAGGGSVTKNPNSTSYSANTSVTLTANASGGSVFGGWSGALSGSANPATVVMNANKNVTATFNPVPTSTPSPTPTPTPPPPPTPSPTPTPTPPPSGCGSGGACTASQVAAHSTKPDCWVYLRSPYNKVYNVTNYVTNGNTHPGGDVIVPHCGGDIYDYFIGNAGGHRHSNQAINTILQSYYIGPFQP